jgi:hypothetical protein
MPELIDYGALRANEPEGQFCARLDNNRQIEFNVIEHRHFDHGYAVTSHSSQGLTAERVLVHADTSVHPGLLNPRFGYVSFSRARHEVKLFTDDTAKLGPAARSRRLEDFRIRCQSLLVHRTRLWDGSLKKRGHGGILVGQQTTIPNRFFFLDTSGLHLAHRLAGKAHVYVRVDSPTVSRWFCPSHPYCGMNSAHSWHTVLVREHVSRSNGMRCFTS